ncbi:hypothetical protein [Actinoplanes sp. RD1]|uniref:hypothetical protein n=1 Tax=Actinoplanes sp. RD1 TaxID=3064538 RepID=UPI002741B8DA|nr:hypothetical protein [Actinoplanes sp. RD1]
MDAPPAIASVTGLALMPDAPDGVTCWAGQLRDDPDLRVMVLLEGQADALDTGFVDRICADRETHLAAASQAAGLGGEVRRWDPAVTFRGGRSWEVRFTEAPGPTELGLLVVFDGERIVEVDDLSDWDY